MNKMYKFQKYNFNSINEKYNMLSFDDELPDEDEVHMHKISNELNDKEIEGRFFRYLGLYVNKDMFYNILYSTIDKSGSPYLKKYKKDVLNGYPVLIKNVRDGIDERLKSALNVSGYKYEDIVTYMSHYFNLKYNTEEELSLEEVTNRMMKFYGANFNFNEWNRVYGMMDIDMDKLETYAAYLYKSVLKSSFNNRKEITEIGISADESIMCVTYSDEELDYKRFNIFVPYDTIALLKHLVEQPLKDKSAEYKEIKKTLKNMNNPIISDLYEDEINGMKCYSIEFPNIMYGDGIDRYIGYPYTLLFNESGPKSIINRPAKNNDFFKQLNYDTYYITDPDVEDLFTLNINDFRNMITPLFVKIGITAYNIDSSNNILVVGYRTYKNGQKMFKLSIFSNPDNSIVNLHKMFKDNRLKIESEWKNNGWSTYRSR